MRLSFPARLRLVLSTLFTAQRSRLIAFAACGCLLIVIAVRLIPTPSSAATAELAPAPQSHKQRPLVAVIRGDKLGPGGESMAATADRHFQAVTKALEAARIPYVVTSDSAIERDGVPANIELLILPYNRAVSEVQLGHLLHFIYGGGKIVACLLGRNDLLYAIGVDPKGVSPAADLGITGADIVSADETVAGMPRRVRQPAAYVMKCQPLAGAATVAWWENGGKRVAPAAVVNSGGAFITTGLTADHVPETAQLLRALIGHLVPAVWEQSIPSSPDRLGPYGPYSTLSDLAASVHDKSARGQDVSPAVVTVAEALALLEDADRMTRETRFEESLQAVRKADELANRAVWESFAHVEGEMRGVWTHNYAQPSWEQAAAVMSEANLNAVFPYICSGGVAFYASRILPHHHTVATQGDWLAQAASACKKYGLKLHPRMLNLSTLFASEATRKRLKSQGRLVVTHQGKSGTWLCPTNTQNRREQVDAAREIVTEYDVAGLQFDYLRYENRDTCFCPACRAAFEARLGRKVARWPADAYSGSLKGQYTDFRRHQIDTLVAEIVNAVRAARPGIEVSAAAFLNWESHRDTFGQDWKKWVDDGLLDFVSPMSYTANPDTFRTYVRRQNGWVDRKVPLYVGIGVNADNCRFTEPYQLVQQIEIAREEGADGWIVFNYCPMFTDEFLPVLSQGVTRQPTAYRLH